jgi:hypothetical protein
LSRVAGAAGGFAQPAQRALDTEDAPVHPGPLGGADANAIGPPGMRLR